MTVIAKGQVPAPAGIIPSAPRDRARRGLRGIRGLILQRIGEAHRGRDARQDDQSYGRSVAG